MKHQSHKSYIIVQLLVIDSHSPRAFC